MANRKRRSLEELYKLTGNLSKPKITPILQGNYHMQGPVDDSDNGIEINKEADSGDKILVEESNQHSFDSSDTVPILKTRACDDQRHTSSGTSNLASPSSSHDSFFENAESKTTMRTSDTSDCSLLDNGIKEQADEQILECHGDSISCVAGVKNTSKLSSDPVMGLDGMNGSCCTDSTRREGFEKVLEVDTSHDSLIDCSCGGEGDKTSIKDPSSKKNPSKATAGFSHDSDPSEFPSSIEGITSPKAEVPSSDSRSTSSVIYTADSKDLEENSSSQHGAGPSECSTGHDETSLPEPVTTNDIDGSKSAAPDSFDILPCPEDTKAGHIRSNSSAEAVMKFYPCLETENSVDLLASDAEKREPPSASQQASESDHSGSDILEDDVKVCDICGDAGREDLLAVCSRCNDGAEHTYCMQTMLDKVPEGDWLCEECKLKEDAETQKSYASESTSTTPKLPLSNDKIENCKGTFNPKALSTLDTKVLCTNRNKPLKAISNPQLPVKRHSENQEVASTTRKQVLEMATGLQGVISPGKKPALSREASIKNVDTGNPGKKPALSRDTSLKNMDIGKVKLTHLATLPGSHSANNSRETGKSLSNFGSNSPAILTKLQSSLSSKLAVPGSSESGSASPSGSSNFAPKHHIHSKAPDSPVPRPKLSVFQNLNLKTKVKQVWEDPSQKQKLARESTNSDVKKEGLVRTLSRSMSNSSFRFRSNSGESKTKMQNLNLFRTEDSRGLKQAEEPSHSMERKNSFKSDHSLTTSSLTAAARISHPKVDPKIIIPHGQNVSLPVPLVGNHSDLKATEVDGKIKTSAEPTVLAPVKGSENTIVSAGIGVMKKQLLPNSGDFEGTGCNPDMLLQDGLFPSLESTNRDGRSRQSFMPGGRVVPQVRCFKCKEIGHIALYCNSNLGVSAVTTSVSLPVPLVSNHSDLKATEVDGKIKTSADPTVLAPVKGSENTIASAGIGDMKKQLLPNSGDFEGTGGNPDMLLQDGLSPSFESTNRDGRSRQSFMHGGRAVPQVRCFKCKEIGHIAQYCNSNLRVSAVTTSAARNSREVTAKSKWKNAVEAAMTKKTRIGETNVLLDRSDELSMLNTVPSCEQVSKDHLSKSIGVDIDINITANSIPSRMKRLPSVEGAIDVQGSLRIPAVDHARATALVGIKHHAFANPTRTSAIPEQHYLWQGGFEVQRSGRFPDCFDGIQAHLSTFASPKVLEVANKLPCKLQLEEVSRLRSWPNPNDKTHSRSKNSIWFNPRRAKASNFRHSFDSRYATLCKISVSLDSCIPTTKSVSEILSVLGENPLEKEAVIVLNNMGNWENSMLVLRYFQEILKPNREVIMYNVTLKVLRKGRQWDMAEVLLNEMLERGIKPDNVTFSTIISFARICSLPQKAVEWFERMSDFGCNPDDVTYSAMIDAYGRAGNVDMALSLYDRARKEKWRLDLVTFSTLIRIYGTAGNFDGALNVYEEMKALDVKPNLVVYNTLLDAMGRAGRPWQVKIFYKEMIDGGFFPNWVTYAALLRAYARARYSEDALEVYREMKEKGMELNVVLYNTLLSMCADVGYVEEALEIFNDLMSSQACKPDSWTFSSLITIYSCSGQVLEAEDMLNKMADAGFEPNIYVLTSLMQCYGKAKRTNDVVRTFDKLLELGITPDDRFCGCLLNVITQTPREDIGKLVDCIEKANAKLGLVVKLLMKEEIAGMFKQEASELLGSIGKEVKKAYCNCLIDLSVNLDLFERACELLDLGLTLEIYNTIQSKTPTQWSLQLRSLSLGAALTALHVWMSDLSKALDKGEEFPPLLGIHTGHGKHKYSEKGLAVAFESHLREIKAPFHEVPDRVGWFLTTNVAAKSWLESRRSSPELVVA